MIDPELRDVLLGTFIVGFHHFRIGDRWFQAVRLTLGFIIVAHAQGLLDYAESVMIYYAFPQMLALRRHHGSCLL